MFAIGSVSRSVARGIVAFLVFGLTAVLAQNPQWGQITAASVIFAILHYLEAMYTA